MGSDHHERHAERPCRSPGAGRGRERLAAGGADDEHEAGRWRVARHRRFPSQRRRGVQRSHRRHRSAARRGALTRRHRRGQEARAEQADAIRPDDASPLRSQRWSAHLCGRRRDGRDASVQRALFREDAGRAGDAQSGCPEQGGEDADAAGCVGQGHPHGRQADGRDLRHDRRHAYQRIHADLPARTEDSHRG